jgi:hypothetical protein
LSELHDGNRPLGGETESLLVLTLLTLVVTLDLEMSIPEDKPQNLNGAFCPDE